MKTGKEQRDKGRSNADQECPDSPIDYKALLKLVQGCL